MKKEPIKHNPIEWKEFLKLCSSFKTEQELEQFFDLFLTLEEKQTIIGRYLVIKALKTEKITQREIAEKYRASISQITRGSNALKIINKQLKNKLDKHFGNHSC